MFTARIKRLYLCLFIVSFIINGLLGVFGKVYLFPLMLLTLLLVSVLVLVASLIMIPVEKGIGAWYVNDAKKILQSRKDLKIVAITGSYGKTSTKFILSTILSAY